MQTDMPDDKQDVSEEIAAKARADFYNNHVEALFNLNVFVVEEKSTVFLGGCFFESRSSSR